MLGPGCLATLCLAMTPSVLSCTSPIEETISEGNSVGGYVVPWSTSGLQHRITRCRTGGTEQRGAKSRAEPMNKTGIYSPVQQVLGHSMRGANRPGDKIPNAGANLELV